MFGKSVVTENGNLGAGSRESGKLALGSIENGGCFRKWGFEDCLDRIFFTISCSSKECFFSPELIG